MHRARWGLALILVSVLSAPASAAVWGIGSNLGMNILIPDQSSRKGGLTVSWPGSSTHFMPGLRFAVRGEEARSTWYVDTGFQLIDQGDFGQSSFEGSLNYMRAFGSERGTVPFVTVGGGFATRMNKNLGPGGESVNPVSAVFGGGLGLRKAVAKGAGSLRLEARYDYVTEGKDFGVVLIPAGGVAGLKLGFDLWFR
jgi:hypothetical protein